jgi:hypothetical protein
MDIMQRLASQMNNKRVYFQEKKKHNKCKQQYMNADNPPHPTLCSRYAIMDTPQGAGIWKFKPVKRSTRRTCLCYKDDSYW